MVGGEGGSGTVGLGIKIGIMRGRHAPEVMPLIMQ